MSTCDLCKASCSAVELTQLRDIYRIDGVVDICPACRKWADERLSALRLGIAPTMKALLEERRGRVAAHADEPKPAGWIWQSVFGRREA